MEIKNSRVFPALIAAILFGLAAFSARAGNTNGYEGPRWAFLDAKQVMQAAAEITKEKYPDCDEATVDKKMVRVYRPDGTGECQDEAYVKVLTEKGKRANRSHSEYYQLPYSTAEVIKVEVLKPNGSVVPIYVAANSKEMIDDSQMAMNIYDPNTKIIRVNIPGVEIGDVVHVIARTTMHRSIIPGEFAEYNVFEGPGYIRHESYEVYEPAERPLKRIVLRDEVAGTITHTTKPDNNCTLHRWEVNNVPRMFDEPSMPPYEMVLQRLMVSTTPDWQAVSKWYAGVCQPHLDATTPEMKKTVEELTADSKTEMDRLKAVFYYVSKKIRYMGLTPEKDRPGFEPHDVRLTFENKYGVCRDKAALLVAMLRTAGFQSYPVLVSVGSKKDPEVADPFFNHAIVCAELKQGEYVLMDPTAENTKELLPSYECNQSYLVTRPEGEVIRTSPIIPPEDNMMRIKTTATLTAAGTVEAKSELSFDGINDNEYREAFSRMKPDDKRRFFERNLKRSIPGARLKSLKLMPEDMLDISSGLRAELEFSVDGMTACGAGKAVVNLPWLGRSLGIVNFILGGTGLEKRKYPLRTDIACGLKEDIEIKTEGFSGALSMPVYPPISDECLRYERRVQDEGTTLSCSREFKMKAVEFSPEQYLKLKKTLKAMEYDDRKAPVMAIPAQTVAAADPPEATGPAPAVASNAEILESHKEMEIKDAHTDVYKVRYAKRILTYSGKKNEAEIKIAYNPACDEAKLVRGTVISKNGDRKEISTNEMNIMDESWNASARRYTGGKVLVANLPGVDIGSTIEIEYQVTSKARPFVCGFESFQLFDDLNKKDFTLTAPANLRVQTYQSGPAGIMTVHTNSLNGMQIIHWDSGHMNALPAEPQLPPEWTYMAGVQFYAGDSKAYLKDLRTTMLDRSGKHAKAAEKARELKKTATTKLELVTAIRDFIEKSIRLAGPSFSDLPLSELSAADTTLTDGYGHAADRAILFHAMLSAAGFKPEFVLASGLPPIPGVTNVTATFPLPQSFQAPLVKVVVDGTPYYLNDTDQYARFGSTGHDGRLGIVLSTQATEVIRAAKNCSDKVDTTYSLSVADDGKTRVGIARHYFGSDFNAKHRFFAELPPEERRRYHQEIVSDVAQGARPTGDLVTKFDSYPGLEQFTVEVDNYSVVDGKYLYFDLPFTPSLFPPGADRRTLPLFIGHRRDHTIRTEIELPSGFHQVAIAPKSGTFSAPAGCGQAQVTTEDRPGKIVLTHELDTSPAIISAKDYPAMLKLEAALENKSSKLFLLERDSNATASAPE